MKVTMAKLMRRLLPSLILRNPVELAALSRDPAVVEAARTDPQYHNLISTRFGWDLLQNMDWLASQAGRFPLPLLLMQGTADRVVDPQASLDLVARLQGDITLKTWDGFYHELHNEPERNQVIDFMVDWVNRRLPA